MDGLAGRTLAEVAARAGVSWPPDLARAKGWVGQLLERALGAAAGSRAEPDFPSLGVELKTLPVGADGRPRESTFVATLDLESLPSWEASAVRRKLARVAWVPVQANPAIPPPSRRVGNGILWSPTAEQGAVLQADYETVLELIAAGFLDRITARRGIALQLRPKGADSQALRWASDEEGARVRVPPRAFYLRSSFTEGILRERYQRS